MNLGLIETLQYVAPKSGADVQVGEQLKQQADLEPEPEPKPAAAAAAAVAPTREQLKKHTM